MVFFRRYGGLLQILRIDAIGKPPLRKIGVHNLDRLQAQVDHRGRAVERGVRGDDRAGPRSRARDGARRQAAGARGRRARWAARRSRRPRPRRLRIAASSASRSTIGPRAVLTRTRPGLAAASASRADQLARLVAQRRVHADDIRAGHEIGERMDAVIAGREIDAGEEMRVVERRPSCRRRRPGAPRRGRCGRARRRRRSRPCGDGSAALWRSASRRAPSAVMAAG